MSDTTYTIIVRGARHPVSKEVYQEYHRHREHERYLNSLAANQERSLERFALEGVSAEYRYAMAQPSLEDQVIHKQQLIKMREALTCLNDEERSIIYALYFTDISERDLAKRLQMPQKTLNCKKQRILHKLLKAINS